MLNLFRKKTNPAQDEIVSAVVSQTAILLEDMRQKMELRFNELSSQIKEVELGLAQMETKLLTKDLKDKQAYGLLHYKLHEAKNQKLEMEIDELEEKMSFRNKLKNL